MSDHTDAAADTAAGRLDAWLDVDHAHGTGDDLANFARHVVDQGKLPADASTVPDRGQRARIRARVFDEASPTPKARPTMTPQPMTATPDFAPPPPPARADDPSRPSALSMLMTAAILVLIGLAAFGLFRDSIGLGPGGDNPAPHGVSGIAFSPQPSPAATAACDFRSTPLFFGSVPDVAGITSYTLLDDTDMFTAHCDGSDSVLARNVRYVTDLVWRDAFLIVTNDDEVRVLNVATGASLDLESKPLLKDDGTVDFDNVIYQGTPEPWLITAANTEQTNWRITDLRSMDSFLLSDDINGPLPRAYVPYFSTVTGTDVAVVTWQGPLPAPATPAVQVSPRQLPLRSAALVLPGSIESHRWIRVVNWNTQGAISQFGGQQISSVSRDGSLLAYTTVTSDNEQVIRIEEAADGAHVADIPVDGFDYGTSFLLAGSTPHLVHAHGDKAEIITWDGDIARTPIDLSLPATVGAGFWPTADPDTVLASSGTSVTPINVSTGAVSPTWRYVPSIYSQIFGSFELPQNIVRVVSNELGGTPATIQLVNPSTGDVMLESDPIDFHPLQIVASTTWLRNRGQLAVVQIRTDEAVVMNATTGEVWTIGSPVDDSRAWRFVPSQNGRFLPSRSDRFISAIPDDITAGDTARYYIAPLEPGAEWVPVDGTSEVIATPVARIPAMEPRD